MAVSHHIVDKRKKWITATKENPGDINSRI